MSNSINREDRFSELARRLSEATKDIPRIIPPIQVNLGEKERQEAMFRAKYVDKPIEEPASDTRQRSLRIWDTVENAGREARASESASAHKVTENPSEGAGA